MASGIPLRPPGSTTGSGPVIGQWGAGKGEPLRRVVFGTVVVGAAALLGSKFALPPRAAAKAQPASKPQPGAKVQPDPKAQPGTKGHPQPPVSPKPQTEPQSRFPANPGHLAQLAPTWKGEGVPTPQTEPQSTVQQFLQAQAQAQAEAQARAQNPARPVAAVDPTTPKATSAGSKALSAISSNFPSALPDEDFLRLVASELTKLGFKRTNCIALVNTCRDEVCRPIVNLIDREFGLSFNISGLGGLLNCGKTAFKAAMSHSPLPPCPHCGLAKERYIFFAFPHVSVGPDGDVGCLLRSGRGKPSGACGALIAIQNDIKNRGPLEEDADDEEYIRLKQKVISKLGSYGAAGPTLLQMTVAAQAAMSEDLEKLIAVTVNPDVSDYAVITGVQIHSSNPVPGDPYRIERTPDYIAPCKMYAVVSGRKHKLQLPRGRLG